MKIAAIAIIRTARQQKTFSRSESPSCAISATPRMAVSFLSFAALR